MSDIFISYKREEQGSARRLANALENEGWDVWWDPKLRAGEHFDDVIEAALKACKCVVVLWSKLSVNSRYVKDEATYALNRKKLVPVVIDEVELPFRFEGLHTPRLIGWDGADDFPEFQKLLEDISAIVRPRPVSRRQRASSSNRSPRTQRTGAAENVQEMPRAVVRETFKSGTIFRDTLKDGSQGPEMVVIPAGEFQMGDLQRLGRAWELPVHMVTIAKPFAIGKYPVTFEEYDRFAAATGRALPDDMTWGRGRQPVIGVSWEDSMAFANWLSAQTDQKYRLPSEAEWEYAARAGTATAYWWGNEMKPGMANYDGSDSRWGGKQTSPVGSFPPNHFGLYDTAGNVWEWVQDCWHENYKGAPVDGSAWEENDSGRRVRRGGSWYVGPVDLRSSLRTRVSAVTRLTSLGIRLAQDLS